MSLHKLAVLLLTLTATTACQQQPEAVCLAFDHALHIRDLDAVRHLVSRASLPAVEVLWRAGSLEKSPLRLPADAPSLQVRSVRAQGLRQIATVAQGKTEREWVLIEEDGRWRVDLFETALRRPWNNPTATD